MERPEWCRAHRRADELTEEARPGVLCKSDFGCIMHSQRNLIAELPDTERYEIRRRLGAGSFGVVYEGWDRERDGPVAIKWLTHVDVETIHRLKTEFRSLAEISHPNLVQLYELASDGDRWFFTMELVRGLALPMYLRPDSLPPGPATLRRHASGLVPRGAGSAAGETQAASDGRRPTNVDMGTVKAVFSQLARGVHALHEAGKLHRDLKCQNVMVDDAGRVVILDFGLVRPIGTGDVPEEVDLAGTPLYMAPEQCAGEHVGRPADWYAVGVMLFRALTERFPFDGPLYDVMRAKRERETPRVDAFVDGVPSEFVELTAELLAMRPEDRPTGVEVLERLGVQRGPSVAFPPGPAEVFVGRERERAVLSAARAELHAKGPTAVYVHGASGMGKTALVRRFLAEARRSAPAPLVLEGRCFERERLPYKALDPVVDNLAAVLRQMSEPEQRELVPPHAAELVRVFPALARVPSFRKACQPAETPCDPQERRRRASEAFSELFRRLARRHEVIVFIDDLQWGDRDSAMLIAPLLEMPSAPVLWLGTFRTDEAASSPYLEHLDVLGTGGARSTRIELAELTEAETRELLESRLAGECDEELFERLAREAGGSPLFIDLLVRRVRSSGPVALDLAAVIEERLEELAPEARCLLSVLALRGRPIERTLAGALVGVGALDVTLLTHLRNGRLIRLRETDKGEELEIYHDRIRETVASRLAPEEERRLHAQIAEILEARGGDPESLAYHHRGAHQLPEALHFTLEAARRAEAALAFERAAELYRSAIVLRIQLSEGPKLSELRAKEGYALKNAGRGAEAARAFLAAAAGSPRDEALTLRRLAGEQYLMSGHLEESRAVMRDVLEEHGMSMPEHPARVLAELLVRRAQVRIRGSSFVERPEAELDPAELRRIDLCWGISCGLAMIDPVRGGVFQSRHLLAALEAGELKRVARAVAVEIPFSATAGMPNRRRTAELERLGRELAERAGDDYTMGLLAESSGGAAWLEGRWYDALERVERGIALHRKVGGAAWEVTTATIVLLDVLWRMGRWRELFERYPAVLADATSRGDRLLETYTRVKFRPLRCLAQDQPAEAVRQAMDALSRWPEQEFTLLRLWELFAQVEAELYAGRSEAARERLEASWPALERSQLLRLQMYDVTMRDLAGRVALACAERARWPVRQRHLKDAERAARHLERSGAPWATGPALALRAGVLSTRGEDKSAWLVLEQAEDAFRASAMELHAQVMRARRAELARTSPEGPRGWIEEHVGVARPDRWIALLAPGRWPR